MTEFDAVLAALARIEALLERAVTAREAGSHERTIVTDDELREITGLQRWSAQIRWLRDQGWAYAVRADGRPVVSTKEIERQLVTGGAQRTKGTAEPDFAALRPRDRA